MQEKTPTWDWLREGKLAQVSEKLINGSAKFVDHSKKKKKINAAFGQLFRRAHA